MSHTSSNAGWNGVRGPQNNALQLTRSPWHVPHVEPLRAAMCDGHSGRSQLNAVSGVSST